MLRSRRLGPSSSLLTSTPVMVVLVPFPLAPLSFNGKDPWKRQSRYTVNSIPSVVPLSNFQHVMGPIKPALQGILLAYQPKSNSLCHIVNHRQHPAITSYDMPVRASSHCSFSLSPLGSFLEMLWQMRNKMAVSVQIDLESGI